MEDERKKLIKLSAKAEYALRAILHLCVQKECSKPSQLDEISKAQKIPREFLVQVMSILTKSGMVNSRRGAHGGYILGKMAKEITIRDVIEAVDGSIGEFNCGISSSYCLGEPYCIFRPIWESLIANAIRKLEMVNFHKLKVVAEGK